MNLSLLQTGQFSIITMQIHDLNRGYYFFSYFDFATINGYLFIMQITRNSRLNERCYTISCNFLDPLRY